jgi:hypothetical protein
VRSGWGGFWRRKRHKRTLRGHKKRQQNGGRNGSEVQIFLRAEDGHFQTFGGHCMSLPASTHHPLATS